MISCSPACFSLARGHASFLGRGVMPGLDPGIQAVTPMQGDGPLEWIAGSSPAMTKAGEDKEQAGREGPVPGAGGRPRDTGTCSSARTDARSCSIRTLPRDPPALATPAGGTRRPSTPPGTSLRNATHLNSRSCFVLDESRSESQGEGSKPSENEPRYPPRSPRQAQERVSAELYPEARKRHPQPARVTRSRAVDDFVVKAR